MSKYEQLKRWISPEALEESSFFNSFRLSPREKAAAREVLLYAGTQSDFPCLPGLSKYLTTEKGFNSYYLSTLKKRGIIDNKKKFGKFWSLSEAALNSLSQIANLGPNPPESSSQNKRQLKGKVKDIWQAINQERVGNLFLLTSEFVHSLAARIKCRPSYIWHKVKDIEERYGFFTRKHLPGRGILIDFSSSPNQKSDTEFKSPSKVQAITGETMTVNQFVQYLREEIANIEKQLTALKNLLEEKKRLLNLIETYLNRSYR